MDGLIKELKEKNKKLKEKNKELKKDNFVYRQLIEMQDKREYRSKFLKEFQEEYGTNVIPDYDEVYKRYDKMKRQLKNSIPKEKIEKEIKQLKAMNVNGTTFTTAVNFAIKTLRELLEDK